MTVPLLFFKGTPVTDGGTASNATGAAQEDATDPQGRREAQRILRRLAEYYPGRQHSRRHQGGLQGSLRVDTANIDNTSPATPNVGRSDGEHRQRSVRFAEQERDRTLHWARFFKPVVRDSEEDRRAAPSVEPAPLKSVSADPTFQNGDYFPSSSPNKKERLSYQYRFERCVSTRAYSPFFPALPSVSMARQTVPVQSASVRFISGSAYLHQGAEPLLRWARSQGIRISAYLDDLIIAAATKELSQKHTKMVTDKLSSLDFLTKESKSSRTPSQTLQHLGYEIDTVAMTLRIPGTKIRDMRREASKLINKMTCTVRQLSSFIGKAIAMTAAVFPARLKVQHLQAVKISALKSGLSWEGSIALPTTATEELLWWHTHLPSTMERSLMDSSQSTDRHLHGRFHIRVGSSDQQPIIQWHLAGNSLLPTHQLQGIVDCLLRPPETRGQGSHGQYRIGQYHNNRLHQPFRRDEIARADEASDFNMELVPQDRDQDSNNIRPISFQPRRCPLPSIDRPTRVDNQLVLFRPNGSRMGPSYRRSLRIFRQSLPPDASNRNQFHVVGSIITSALDPHIWSWPSDNRLEPSYLRLRYITSIP